ncbi:hypothetical protein CRG98_014506 [Punica granatum]|uniref:Uncharacterized protein n=1 Tax=Punica granatum TaxID=22663 RepID=A0A2I0K915_PUNGR|nr:hypothetical protein CRG98_014506 [Punica granatum]
MRNPIPSLHFRRALPHAPYLPLRSHLTSPSCVPHLLRSGRSTLPITMSSNHTTDQLELSELCDESDLEKLLSPAGRISICGFGSLLSGYFESERPCEGETLIVTVFEIKQSEVLCAQYSDEEFFRVRYKESKEIYFQHYGRHGIDKIWRDVLPCRMYLGHCVLAAENLGEAVYDNFLDHIYLADCKTTIREYLETSGSGIM